jgi:hypothetical protein
MLDLTDEASAPRQNPSRVFWAIVFGVTIAALVVSRVASDLNGGSALSWLVYFWVFEFVFGVTVTLVATWGRHDDLTRAVRERQRRPSSQRGYL